MAEPGIWKASSSTHHVFPIGYVKLQGAVEIVIVPPQKAYSIPVGYVGYPG